MNSPRTGLLAWLSGISPANLLLAGIAVFFDVVFFFLCFLIGDGAWPLNIATLFCAMALSIPVGILVTPIGQLEIEKFRLFFKLASAFVSGWLLAKVDPFFTVIFSDRVTDNPVWAFWILMFISIFSLSTMTIYVWRFYIRWEPTGGAAET